MLIFLAQVRWLNMKYRSKYESDKGIMLSGCACIVCGWHEKDLKGNCLVEGAHIKPIQNDDSCDCFDNIIALCPNHHTMFDRYLFYIDTLTLRTVFNNKNDRFHNVDVSDKTKHIKKEYLAYRQYLYNDAMAIKV